MGARGAFGVAVAPTPPTEELSLPSVPEELLSLVLSKAFMKSEAAPSNFKRRTCPSCKSWARVNDFHPRPKDMKPTELNSVVT